MIERTIATGTHGRYLIEPPASSRPVGLLVGFHGYGEDAEAQLDRMRRTAGADRWQLLSVQGLHRFYQRRGNQVVASWMTRQDRELTIGDNLAYVAAVIDAVKRDHPDPRRVVFAGFSQGVAVAFRAAASSARADGVIAVGGDVPPELAAAALTRVRRVLICRGGRDEWYTQGTFQRDLERLREAHVQVEALEFDGGHEWSAEVAQTIAAFLAEIDD